MKKLKVIMGLLLLTFAFPVYAEAFLEIDCNSHIISSDDKLTCDVNLIYEDVYIDDIEMEYETNFDISFRSGSKFTLNKDNKKIKLHANETIYDKIMNSVKLFDFTLNGRIGLQEEEQVLFKNIGISKLDADPMEVEEVSEIFEIVLGEVLEDDNCTLDSITVDGKLVPNFNKDVLEYKNIIVDKEIIFIDAKRTSDKSMATGLGTIKVSRGKTIERDIAVTAENGNKKIYKLFITNEISPELSNDNKIKNIELFYNDEKINFNFDENKDKFDIKVDSNVDKVTVKAILNTDSSTFVSRHGPKDIILDYGENKIEIKVKALNGDIKTYTLNITREDNRNSDNTLFSLIINDVEVPLNEYTDGYKINTLDDKTTTIAAANSDKAIINYEDIDLSMGENNYTISVIAENGSKKDYNFIINREEKKILLEDIEIRAYDFDFSKDKHDYNLDISDDTDKLDIIVTPDILNSEIIDNNNLKDNSKVTINVTDGDGINSYVITIHKANKMIDYLCYGIFGIGIIAFIVSIIVSFKRRRDFT